MAEVEERTPGYQSGDPHSFLCLAVSYLDDVVGARPRSKWPRTVQLPFVRRDDLAKRLSSFLSVCNLRLGDVVSIPICLVSVKRDAPRFHPFDVN